MSNNTTPAKFQQSIIEFYDGMPTCYASIIPDAVYGANKKTGRLMSAKTPGDLFACADGGSYLVEVKAVKTKSIRFDALSEHQRDELIRFASKSLTNHGIIAILIGYDRGQTSGRCFLVDIRQWIMWERDKSGVNEKSIPLRALEEASAISPVGYVTELKYKRGFGWDNDTMRSLWKNRGHNSLSLAGL